MNVINHAFYLKMNALLFKGGLKKIPKLLNVYIFKCITIYKLR